VYNIALSIDIYEKVRAQTYEATYSQEPNNHRNGLTELRSVGSLNTVYCNILEEFETDIYVEDSGYTDRAKEPDKNCLPYFIDLVNRFMEGKDSGEASERNIRISIRAKKEGLDLHTL
jgi:hypothetical protein